MSQRARAVSVVGGPASADLARRIARRLRAPYVAAAVRTFDDGESKLTLRRALPARSTAVVVQSTHPPVDTNLVHALTLVSAAASTARSTVAVVPYMGYARQDRAFLAGEAVTMRAVASMFRAAGADRIVTVDIHSREALAHFGRAGRDIAAAPALARHFARLMLRSPLIVSPDKGGERRARRFAAELGADVAVLSKSRDRRTGAVEISGGAGDAASRDVVLVDDMISTGGSIAKAAAFMRQRGCARVHAACTHALLVGGARALMRRARVRVVGTNTVPGASSAVDVSPLIAAELEGL